MKKKTYYFPDGTLVLKTLSMPNNTNANGNIFGGWIVSKMDIGGAILAKEITGGNVATVKITNVTFLKPIEVGDLVSCYAKVIQIGRSSITITIEMWIKNLRTLPIGKYYISTTATFIYVSINKNGQSMTISPLSIL